MLLVLRTECWATPLNLCLNGEVFVTQALRRHIEDQSALTSAAQLKVKPSKLKIVILTCERDF